MFNYFARGLVFVMLGVGVPRNGTFRFVEADRERGGGHSILRPLVP